MLCNNLLPSSAEGWGLWSVHNSSSLLLYPPHIFPLIQHGPWAAILQDKPAPVWRPLWASWRQPVSLWPFHRLQGESLLWHLNTSFPFFSPQDSKGCFSHFSPTLPCCAAFCPFIHRLLPRHHHLWLLGPAMPCSVSIGAVWNGLCPPLGNPGLASWKSPAAPAPAPGHLHLIQWQVLLFWKYNAEYCLMIQDVKDLYLFIFFSNSPSFHLGFLITFSLYAHVVFHFLLSYKLLSNIYHQSWLLGEVPG